MYLLQIPVHPKDQSVNREKYCESPLDVLYNTKDGSHYIGLEIAKLVVGQVEALRLEHPETASLYTLKLVHDPTPCMYPHSIMQLLRGGKKFDRKDASNGAKTLIRRSIAKIANQYIAEMAHWRPAVGFGTPTELEQAPEAPMAQE